MPTQRVSATASITPPVASGDLFYVVDISEAVAADKGKNITAAGLYNMLSTLFRVSDSSDTTKKFAIDVSGAATSTTVTLTVSGNVNLTPGALSIPQATPGTDQTATGLTTNSLNAGMTIALGDLVVLAADGKWDKADATTVAQGDGMLGIALEAGTDTNALNVALDGAFWRNDTPFAFTPGDVLYMSTTAGGITATKPSTTGNLVRVVGYAMTADVIYFHPSDSFFSA